MTISIVAPIYTIARLWSVLNDAATGNIVAHEGVLRVFDLVVVALEAVAFYLVGIGLYHFFIAPLALAEELGLDTMDKLESKLVSVIVVMAALIFLHHLILGKNPADILYYAVGVGIIISALTWFKRQLD